ncbi:hypothetical protein CDAR_59371 [Caerostris darwini]|uniref:Uncharacterized protein n=1 Tax=Caerostris darwini TaxID=1538125 RepID=A0AAV4X2E0_9ARAC|nr:hypothetical protein CDAR_59371 [Caerostris darwini]
MCNAAVGVQGALHTNTIEKSPPFYNGNGSLSKGYAGRGVVRFPQSSENVNSHHFNSPVSWEIEICTFVGQIGNSWSCVPEMVQAVHDKAKYRYVFLRCSPTNRF